MTELLAALGLGLALGIVTGLPLGVVNVAIVDAATRGRTRFATGIGVGGGIADAIHATLAWAGTAYFSEHARPLAIATAAIIVVYIIIARRWHPRVHGSHGVIAGLLLTLPNPAALAAWVAIANATWPSAPPLLVGAGVGIGSITWFITLARLATKWNPKWLPKVAAVLLAAIATFGIVRAFA